MTARRLVYIASFKSFSKLQQDGRGREALARELVAPNMSQVELLARGQESFEKLLGLVGVIDAQHEIFGGYRNGFEIYRNTSLPLLRNDAPLL